MASRRSPHTANQPSEPFDSLVVTHPFHPLAGQRVAVLFERRYQSLGHVYICDGGRLGNVTLPVSFTDRSLLPDSLPVNVEVLAELMATVAVMTEVLTEASKR